jgi:hypothetical protein
MKKTTMLLERSETMLLGDLKLDDFLRHPVWQILPRQPQTSWSSLLAQPVDQDAPLDPTHAEYLVRVAITFADGTKGYGFVKPYLPDENHLYVLCPIILYPGGQIQCYHGLIEPDEETVSSMLTKLDRDLLSEVFPLTYRTDVSLIDGERSLGIPGPTWMKYRLLECVTEIYYLDPFVYTSVRISPPA